MLWRGDGLRNDHTDGHVDNLARFVGPARLAIPEPTENDPNWQVYQRAAQRADMFGRIELVRLPSPGRILHGDEVVPASRSEERRVGKECVSTCRSRWSPYH